MVKLNKKRILLVDDSSFIRKRVSDILKDDFSVDLCSDGEYALEKVRNRDYFLLIVDLVMPFMDGFTLIETLKKQNCKIPIVVFSATYTKESLSRANDLGVVGYIAKPFTSESFNENFRKYCDEIESATTI